MRKTHLVFLSTLLLLTSCTTLDESFRLGAVTGALSGAGAAYALESSTGATPRFENVGAAAGFGLGLGLIMAYFVHKEVTEDREENNRQTDIYFGDLPPSPFVIPNQNTRKRSR